MKINRIDLLAYRCTYWRGKLYCLARDLNLLFSVDPQSGMIELVDAIPEENALAVRLCGNMNVWNDKLILARGRTKKLWIYDLVSKHWDGLNIKECTHRGFGTFTQVYVYDDTIFLIGSSYPAILCLNLKNNSCDYIDAPYQELLLRQADIKYNYFHSHGVRVGNNLYLASCLDNFVLKFDMETRKHNWIEVGNKNHVYSAITWDGENFWLSPRLDGGIVKWDGRENIQNLPLPSGLKQTVPIYSWEACYDGSQIVLPHDSYPKSILINIHDNNIRFCDQQYPLFERLDNGMVVNQTEDGDFSVIMGDSFRKTYHIAIENTQLNQFYEERNMHIFESRALYHEGSRNSLNSLENFLALTKTKSQNALTSGSKVGKTIWETIR